MDQIIAKIEDNLLTCPICFESAFNVGNDFHSLPCQHQICEVCIKDMRQRIRRNEKLKCPVCRKQFEVQQGHTLPTFRYAADLNELVTSLREQLEAEENEAMVCVPLEREQPNQMKQQYIGIGLFDVRFLVLGSKSYIPASNMTMYIIGSESTGIFSLNLFSLELKKFGNFKSQYNSAMVCNEGLLYVFNVTENHVEVYKDEKVVTKWPLEFPEGYMDPCHNMQGVVSLKPFPEGILFSMSLRPCSSSITYAYRIYRHQYVTFEVEGLYSQSTHDEQMLLISRYLCRNNVLCIYRDSLWFVDRRDRHLTELPFEFVFCKCGVHINEPIKHFKIAHFRLGCGFGHKVLYTINRSNSIYQLDLSLLPPLANYRLKNNRLMYTQPTVLEPTILLQLPPDRCFSSLHASENGSLTLIDDDGIVHVYKRTVSASEPITDIKLVEENPASGPEYLTRRQRLKGEMKRALQPLMELFYVFRKLMLLVEIPLFMVLLSMFCIYLLSRYMDMDLHLGNNEAYEDLSDIIARGCQYREPYSVGFKYLHFSTCLESAHTKPVGNCVQTAELVSGELLTL